METESKGFIAIYRGMTFEQAVATLEAQSTSENTKGAVCTGAPRLHPRPAGPGNSQEEG